MRITDLQLAIRWIAGRLGRPDVGQTLVEYVITTGTVALAAVGLLFILGEAVGGPFLETSEALRDALKDISSDDPQSGDSL